MVQSRDEQTGKATVKKVEWVTVRQVKEVETVTLAERKDGVAAETLVTTQEHPFYVEGKGFVPAGSLCIGNSIVTRAGPPLVVKSVTWNRRVEDDHTYFVGKTNGGTWVHNVNCPIVNDPKLKNIAKDLYKGANTPNPIGTGSTADAVRSEMQTGLPVGTTNPAFHSTKARQYAQALEKWLSGNPHADAHDRLVAQTLRDDLRSALKCK